MNNRFGKLIAVLGLLWVCWAVQASPAAPPRMTMMLLTERLAVARLDANASVPAWASSATGFTSITRTAHELSLVCPEAQVPADVKRETGWRILRVEGPLDFALVGILASITTPLAKAGVSLFAISTYDTDYVMVKQDKLGPAVAALRAAGHTVNGSDANGR